MPIRCAQTRETIGITLDYSRTNCTQKSFKATKLLSAAEIDGFAHRIRESDQRKAETKRDPNPSPDKNTGGYPVDVFALPDVPVATNRLSKVPPPLFHPALISTPSASDHDSGYELPSSDSSVPL